MPHHDPNDTPPLHHACMLYLVIMILAFAAYTVNGNHHPPEISPVNRIALVADGR